MLVPRHLLLREYGSRVLLSPSITIPWVKYFTGVTMLLENTKGVDVPLTVGFAELQMLNQALHSFLNWWIVVSKGVG